MIIPDKTPDGREIKSVGIDLSGGADSSLLTYMLAEEAKSRNIQLIAMTVNRPHNIQPIHPPIAKKVIEKINELIDINIKHIIYTPSLETETLKEYADGLFIADQTMVNFSNDLYQVRFTGMTQHPSEEDLKKYFTQLNFQEEIRNANNIRWSERFVTIRQALIDTEKNYNGHKYQLSDPLNLDSHIWTFRPFVNENKKYIASLYKSKNLMETLFPITRSCESSVIVEGHCGKCWWCEERIWAFGDSVC